MLPILQIGPLALPVPQFSLLLALWLGLSLAENLAPRRGISSEALYNLVFTGLAAGLIGARLGYVLPQINSGLALGIFLLKTFFDKLPRDLEDAARTLGLSEWRVFWRVTLPLASRGVFAAANVTQSRGVVIMAVQEAKASPSLKRAAIVP